MWAKSFETKIIMWQVVKGLSSEERLWKHHTVCTKKGPRGRQSFWSLQTLDMQPFKEINAAKNWIIKKGRFVQKWNEISCKVKAAWGGKDCPACGWMGPNFFLKKGDSANDGVVVRESGRGKSMHSCTHLCRGSEIYKGGLYDVGLGVNLAQALSQLRVLGYSLETQPAWGLFMAHNNKETD